MDISVVINDSLNDCIVSALHRYFDWYGVAWASDDYIYVPQFLLKRLKDCLEANNSMLTRFRRTSTSSTTPLMTGM